MIISHKHKFIYIKSAKTAGTSAEVMLAEHCGPEDIITRIAPERPGHHPRNFNKDGVEFWNHIRPWQIQKRISKEMWDSYKKVSVIRNPWDTAVSRYWFSMSAVLKNNRIPFHEWIYTVKKPEWFSNEIYHFNQIGNPICDFYIRFENFSEDINKFCDLVGMPHPTEMVREKTGTRKLKKMHYSGMFRQKDAEYIANKCKRMIEYFGYEFKREVPFREVTA